MSKYKYPFIVVVSAVFLAIMMTMIHPRKKYTVVERRYFR